MEGLDFRLADRMGEVVRQEIMEGRGNVQAEPSDGNAQSNAGVGGKGKPVFDFSKQIPGRETGKDFGPLEKEGEETGKHITPEPVRSVLIIPRIFSHGTTG